MKKRLRKYLLIVISMSLVMNASKFVEAYIDVYQNKYVVELTWLRRDLIYSGITNWSRFLFMGIMPLTIIIYLYAKVYARLVERRKSYQRPRSTSMTPERTVMTRVSSRHAAALLTTTTNGTQVRNFDRFNKSTRFLFPIFIDFANFWSWCDWNVAHYPATISK